MVRAKELRESKGISMKEAARLLSMPYTTYVGYEKGQREPSSEVLIQIADFYETSIDYLVGRTDACASFKRSTIVHVPTFELDNDESDLLRKYRALDSAGKGRIKNAIDYEYNSLPGSKTNTAPKEA